MHPLLRYVLVATTLCAGVFLLSSAFFSSWNGVVISHRPPPADANPSVLRVLIVDEGGAFTEQDWPREMVERLELNVDASGIPPTRLPEDAPRTNKGAFSLFFTVTPNEGGSEAVPTTSAQALSISALLWVLGLLVHNMIRSGSPFSWEPKGVTLPEAQPHGVTVPPPPGSTPATPRRSQPGPPPPKQRRGGGRRR